jgi:prophage DNA circulation protein
MANSLQTRQLPTEFSIQVAKFFNDLEVTSDAECNQKLEQISEGNEEAADMLEDLKNAWSEWESFLEKVDKSVEQLAGPCNPKSITSTDSKKNSRVART